MDRVCECEERGGVQLRWLLYRGEMDSSKGSRKGGVSSWVGDRIGRRWTVVREVGRERGVQLSG